MTEAVKPTSRTARQIEGWTVLVDDRLLQPPEAALGARVLKMLEARLTDIASVAKPQPLAKLRAVTIVVDLSHGKLRTMRYYSSVGW